MVLIWRRIVHNVIDDANDDRGSSVAKYQDNVSEEMGGKQTVVKMTKEVLFLERL